MSTGPAVATATVRIIPDTTGFRAALQEQVAIATRGVTATVQAQVAGTAAAANATALSGVSRGAGGAGRGAAGGINSLKNESNALRGSLIGLSRVTPVTVFGLTGYGVAGIAAGLAIRSAIKSTADFEHQLNVFQATTGATALQMELIEAKAKALGADLSLPATSAGDAALAMTELAKAGLSVNDTLAGSTGVLQLAAAAQIDVGSAAQFVATQLNAFGLSGDKATHVADLLAGASIAAQGSIIDFGTSFQQVSAVSKQVGVSIETTTGALVELAKAGLRGADGGTSLRTTLLRLAPTTKQAADYMEALGIRIDKTKTIGQQLPDLIDQYRASLEALTPVQQQQALTQIFGQDAIRAASILIRGGSEALRENTQAANDNGAAARLAAANAKGLSGEFSGLKSQLDTLGITLGGFVVGPLTGLVSGLADATSAVGSLAESLGKLGSVEVGGVHLGNKLKFIGKLGVESLVPGLGQFLQGRTIIDNLFKDDTRAVPGEADFTTGVHGRPLGARGKPLSAAQAAAVQTRIARLAEDKERRKPLPGDTQATNKLQIAQLNAQLRGSLTAELAADKNIETYFRERLELAKKGTDRYTNILGALQGANSASRSVQSQIDAEADAATAEAKRNRDEHTRKLKRDAAQAKADARDAAQAAKDLFNLEKSRFDLAIASATQLHPKAIGLQTAAYNREIAFLNGEIKRIQKSRKLTVELKQQIVNYRSDIVSLKAARNALKDNLKDNTTGFSLGDLFKEAISQFNQFGSNVSSSVTTSGGVRGALGGAIASQNPNLSRADRLKLAKAEDTNDLLRDIRDAVVGRDGPTLLAGARDPVGPAGFATGAHARRFSKVRGK
jgi:TP901 family phage tail tape measure protein